MLTKPKPGEKLARCRRPFHRPVSLVVFVIGFVRLTLLVTYKDTAAALLRTFTRALHLGRRGAGGCGSLLVMGVIVIHAIVTPLLFVSIMSMIAFMLVDAFRKSSISTSLFLEEEVFAGQLLLLVHLGLVLIDTRTVRVGVPTESDIQVLEELVASGEQALGGIGASIH